MSVLLKFACVHERMYTNTPMTYMMNLLKINQVQKSLLFFHFFLDFCKSAHIYLPPNSTQPLKFTQMKMKTFKLSIELSMQESIAYDIAPCNMKSKEFKESLEKLISDHYFGYCYAHEFQVKVK